MHIKTTKDFKIGKWSGGSTTELFIYPENADYQLRNFDFRISSARVEVEESHFTALAGFSRKLMILEGEIEISHKNRYSKHLKKFEVDEFEGEWETSAKGICTDFNVMTSKQFKSSLFSKRLLTNELDRVTFDADNSHLFVYVWSGKVEVVVDLDTIYLQQGELLVLDSPFTILDFNAFEDSEMIIVKIDKM